MKTRMIYNCPNLECKSTTKNGLTVKDGFYFRRDDSRKIQRYVCKKCKKKFSKATFSLERHHKKRRVNYRLFRLMTTPCSMNRAARELHINYKTVQRKMEYLAKKSKIKQAQFIKKLERNKVISMQFDDLITIEHTKMKPLSITLAVDKKTRYILGAKVSTIPAFGLIADKSRKKYGPRRNNHSQNLDKLFKNISKSIAPNALIESDEHQAYPKYIRKYFPNATHHSFRSFRGSIAGQGELKKVRFDPLFTINHTFAMLRGHINRLVRKTWCTTKRIDMLQNHVDIFISYFNFFYLKECYPH